MREASLCVQEDLGPDGGGGSRRGGSRRRLGEHLREVCSVSMGGAQVQPRWTCQKVYFSLSACTGWCLDGGNLADWRAGSWRSICCPGRLGHASSLRDSPGIPSQALLGPRRGFCVPVRPPPAFLQVL